MISDDIFINIKISCSFYSLNYTSLSVYCSTPAGICFLVWPMTVDPGSLLSTSCSGSGPNRTSYCSEFVSCSTMVFACPELSWIRLVGL